MPKSRAWAAVALALAVSLPVACRTPAARPGASVKQVLRVPLTAAPRSLDPAQGWTSVEAELGRLCWQPLLLASDPATPPAPGAAESFDLSPDGLTYTFHLRPGARWSDGSPVVAKDFLVAWRRLIDPRTAAPAADLFASAIKGGLEAHAQDPKGDPAVLRVALAGLGLSAPDPLTFQVTLAQREGWFPWLATLWQGGPVRPDMVQRGDWASGPATLPANGPFRIVSASSSQIRLERNPDYWGPRPQLQEVKGLVVPSAADRLRLYRQGKLDMTDVAPDLVAKVDRSGLRGQMLTRPLPEEVWAAFNSSRAPFDDSRIRLAVARAIDRPALIRKVLSGAGRPDPVLVPDGLPGHFPDLASQQAYDPAAAKTVLAAASGAARLEGATLLTTASPSGTRIAKFLVVQVRRQLGVTLKVSAVSSALFYKRISSGDFQIAAPIGWRLDYPDPQDWYGLFLSTNGDDWSQWRDPEYDQLVTTAAGLSDQGQRLRLYRQAAILLAAQAPAAFLYQPVAFELVSPRLRGLVPTLLDDLPFLGNRNPTGIGLTGR